MGIEALNNKVQRGAGSRVEAPFNRMLRDILTDETQFEPWHVGAEGIHGNLEQECSKQREHELQMSEVGVGLPISNSSKDVSGTGAVMERDLRWESSRSKAGLRRPLPRVGFFLRIINLARWGCSTNSTCDDEDATMMLCSFCRRKVEWSFGFFELCFYTPGTTAENRNST